MSFWDASRGVGFVRSKNTTDPDAFLHIGMLKVAQMEEPSVGDFVEYEMEEREPGKWRVTSIALI